MKTPRQKVLSQFYQTRRASAREISSALKMPVANVRHHLRVLASDGRLVESVIQSHEKKGRPEKVYSLPHSVLGDNLPLLSDALLTTAGSHFQAEALAGRLAGEANLISEPLLKRLNLIVEKLNEMNYHARWEAGVEGPRVIFGHCPYASIIEKHPELCVMDAALLEKLMGYASQQLTKIGHEGSLSCVFAMRR